MSVDTMQVVMVGYKATIDDIVDFEDRRDAGWSEFEGFENREEFVCLVDEWTSEDVIIGYPISSEGEFSVLDFQNEIKKAANLAPFIYVKVFGFVPTSAPKVHMFTKYF